MMLNRGAPLGEARGVVWWCRVVAARVGCWESGGCRVTAARVGYWESGGCRVVAARVGCWESGGCRVTAARRGVQRWNAASLDAEQGCPLG